MAARDVPEPWAALLQKANLVDRRNGRPSMTRLAEAAGVHASTVGAMMYGTRESSADTIDAVAQAVATALRMENPRRRRELRRLIHEWAGRSLTEPSKFLPHPDADLLTKDEREAVNELIRLLAASRKTRNEMSALSVRPDLAAVAKEGAVEESGEFE